ncbi:MAG: DUF1622 domain-containing protein [Gammaproteobacteria bacterium]|nr:DUF1622 domain-containing protein [Gammaproteobacteria bacterium]
MEWLSFHLIFLSIQRAISLIGVLIILSGVLLALSQYLRYFFTHQLNGSEINAIRSNLGRILILGLEFIVAADLINTTTTPDYYSVGILACIVAIRTILSYTLNREITMISKDP